MLADQQIEWMPLTKCSSFGVIKTPISQGTLESLNFPTTPAWSWSDKCDLAEYISTTSPDRYLVSTEEGSLHIKVSSLVAQGKQILSAMSEADNFADYTLAHVATLVRGSTAGSFGFGWPTFRQLPESLGEIRDTSHYDHHFDLFCIDAIVGKRLYDIGSGGFRHSLWTNIDYKSTYYSGVHIDIYWDAENMLLYAPSGRAGAVYTSHSIEYLQEKGARNLFNEAYRMLQTGGAFRITCSEFNYYFEDVQSRDRYSYTFFFFSRC